MKNIVLVTSLVFLLSACSSSVKLNDVQVEDKTGSAVTQNNDNSNASSRPVESVTTDASNALGAKAPLVDRVIYFDYDSFVVRPEFQSAIEAHAKFINNTKSSRVVVEGHTDERGGREYNLALGQKRAEAVRQSFKLLGVADTQIEAVSFGKEKPAVMGSTDEAMSKNRRAEISYR